MDERERVIYEWLDERLKGLEWHKVGSDEDGWRAVYERQADFAPRRRYAVDIPLLDMNCACDACIPKLVAEGLDVLILIGRDAHPVTIEIGGDIRWHGDNVRDTFYEALLAYTYGLRRL